MILELREPIGAGVGWGAALATTRVLKSCGCIGQYNTRLVVTYIHPYISGAPPPLVSRYGSNRIYCCIRYYLTREYTFCVSLCAYRSLDGHICHVVWERDNTL